MLYCVVNLVTKHVEEPLECLCNLLRTVGKELEQVYNYIYYNIFKFQYYKIHDKNHFFKI
jgi:hypothetical protein